MYTPYIPPGYTTWIYKENTTLGTPLPWVWEAHYAPQDSLFYGSERPTMRLMTLLTPP